ncbi:MAG: baseplate J/gp47 family protein [Sphingobium sp.]
MADTFTAVDLSKLPAPSVVEALDYETIYADILADFLEREPDFDATVESDPAVKLLQVAALREFTIRARINDAARAVMVAFAEEGDLDHLAAVFGVERLTLTPADTINNVAAVMEDDTDLRRRVLLAPEGYSVAGPEGAYIFHALSASSDVLDASAVETEQPGEVLVTVLSRNGAGAAAPELVATVAAYLSDETRRPLTDMVTVQSAQIVDYAVIATLTTFAGPDSAIVLAESRARLDAYIAETHRLGRDITRAGIIAALYCPGVQNVDLASPAADIVLDRTQAGNCTGIAIAYAGTGE